MSPLAGVPPLGVPVTQYNFVYFHNAPRNKYQSELSLATPLKDKFEEFLVVNES